VLADAPAHAGLGDPVLESEMLAADRVELCAPILVEHLEASPPGFLPQLRDAGRLAPRVVRCDDHEQIGLASGAADDPVRRMALV
jgi:hypothetical protein